MSFSLAISGFYTSLLSLAPNYTGLLTSLMMIAAYAGRLVTPRIVPLFNKNGRADEWRMIFYFMAASTIASGLFFLVFGSGLSAANRRRPQGGSLQATNKHGTRRQERKRRKCRSNRRTNCRPRLSNRLQLQQSKPKKTTRRRLKHSKFVDLTLAPYFLNSSSEDGKKFCVNIRQQTQQLVALINFISRLKSLNFGSSLSTVC